MTPIPAERDARVPRLSSPASAGMSPQGGQTGSLAGMIAVVMRHRRFVLGVPIALAAITVAVALFTPRTYTASTSFTPRATDVSKSGLGNIAAQFGVAVPGSDPSQSPDFYVDLLLSRPVLHGIVDTTYALGSGAPQPLAELLEADGTSAAERSDDAIRRLRELLGISKNSKTGVIRVSVSTKWPRVSMQIAQRLVELVNAFNLRARQAKARDEAQFAEERVADLNGQLRRAEEDLADFHRRNRTYGGSPELALEEQRLNRAIAQRQEIYTTVVRMYEQMRLDAVRSTPVITVVEPAEFPVRPDRRNVALKAMLALVFGAGAAVFLVFMRETLRSGGVVDDEAPPMGGSASRSTEGAFG